jgi:four helix bundle protein
MGTTVNGFEELDAYKALSDFRIYVFKYLTTELLNQKDFGLADQIRRSSRSITENLAEGSGRFRFMDNYKFCSIARGELNETLEHPITAHDDGLRSDEILDNIHLRFQKASNLLNGSMAYLRRSAKASLNN